MSNLRQSADPYGLESAYRDSLKAAKPSSHKVKKPIYMRVWFWLLVVLVVLVVAARIALNPLAAHFTQKGLDSITDYHGSFESVRVSIIPLTYTITDLIIDQDGSKAKEPVVYAHQARAQLFWRKLFKLQAVGTLSVSNAKFVIMLGETKPPPEAPQSVKEVAEELEFNAGNTLRGLFPFRLDRIELRESEANLIDTTNAKAPPMWVKDIELVLENLVSRQDLEEKVPMQLTLRAVVAKTGILKVLASADLLEEKPAFTGEAQLSGLKLESLYPWTSAKAGVSASGTVDMFINFISAKGKLNGDVKVLIRNAHVKPADERLSDAVKAKIANLAITVLSDRVEGRDAIATTMPIKGTMSAPDAQIWPTILGVVRNAFVQGLDWGFSDLPTPTAEKKEGPLGQAAKALDKDRDSPKAQPQGKAE